MHIVRAIILITVLTTRFYSSTSQTQLAQALKIANKIDTGYASESSFQFLDETVKKYKVFFSGEVHNYTEINNKIAFKYFKYLNKQAQVKHLLCEGGYSLGYLANLYMRGDTAAGSILKRYIYASNFNYFVQLRQLYQSLPEEQKFTIHGIDVDSDYELAIEALVTMLPLNLPKDDSLRLNLMALKAMNKYNREHIRTYDFYYGARYNGTEYDNYQNVSNFMGEFLRLYRAYKSAYAAYLGDQYINFNKVIESVGVEREWQEKVRMNTPHDEVFRDRYLYKNFVALYNQDTVSGYFGQFGACHTWLKTPCSFCHLNITYPFIHCLNTNFYQDMPALSGRVMSVLINYFSNSSSIIETSRFKRETSKIESATPMGLSYVPFDKIDTTIADIVDNFQGGFFYKTDTKEKRTEAGSSYWHLINLDFDYGAFRPSVRTLNNRLTQNNFSAIPTQWIVNRYSISVNEDADPANEYEIYYQDIRNMESLRSTDSMSAIASGWGMGFNFGVDVLAKPTQHFTLHGGLGYMLGRVTFSKKDNGLAWPPVNATPSYQINNPAFMMQVGATYRFNFLAFNLHLKGGYQFDLSNKTWKNNNNFLNDGSKTNWSGIYFLGGAGFTIDD